MNFNLSIVICHFLPEHFNGENPLIKTLDIINRQNKNLNIEIIIADDGSFYNKEITKSYSGKIEIKDDIRDIYYIEEEKLSDFLNLKNIKNPFIKKWVYLPKLIKCMAKAKVTNYAVQLSNSDNLLFLDDDNYFISKNSINEIIDLFKNYDFIVGQIMDNNNRLRQYKSSRVQGTTIGIKRKIFNNINGFGEWTENFSCGVDSDFWFKVYKYFQNNNSLKSCYTNKFSTYDSCSKRWKRFTKILQDFKLKKEFNKIHGCKNYKSKRLNPSRNKKVWIESIIEQ